MSGVHHSDEAVERIFDMTIDKKARKSFSFKRLASVALAFALLVVGGGFGTSAIVQNYQDKQPLGVMVASADDFIKIEGSAKQSVFKSLYFAPADNEELCKKQYAKAQADYNKNREAFDKIANKMEVSASLSGVGSFDIVDKQGNTTGKLYTTGAGYFVASKKNYKNLKSFTVENESEYGFLQFEWSGTSDLMEAVNEDNVNEDNPYECFINHKFTLTGDELRHSQKNFDLGGYGYMCEWRFAPEIFEKYDSKFANGIDATSIKDRITFTFEYENGTVQTASINISFDSNGHMIVS